MSPSHQPTSAESGDTSPLKKKAKKQSPAKLPPIPREIQLHEDVTIIQGDPILAEFKSLTLRDGPIPTGRAGWGDMDNNPDDHLSSVLVFSGKLNKARFSLLGLLKGTLQQSLKRDKDREGALDALLNLELKVGDFFEFVGQFPQVLVIKRGIQIRIPNSHENQILIILSRPATEALEEIRTLINRKLKSEPLAPIKDKDEEIVKTRAQRIEDFLQLPMFPEGFRIYMVDPKRSNHSKSS